ncbi:transposase family protein [Vibrio metschnikovii]|uniref:transposase family protein n=1 Tax=Vibrio metschnikovii TaxID=28172 RepID=UPI001C2FF872
MRSPGIELLGILSFRSFSLNDWLNEIFIIKHLDKVRDTRSHLNQVYPVIDVAFLVISAMLCEQNKWTDIKDFGKGNLDWLRQHLSYENGIPTRHNITTIMKAMVADTMIGWINSTVYIIRYLSSVSMAKSAR